MKKTVLLTSEHNFKWQSMQEIMPFLVQSWLKSSSPEHLVLAFNVDHIPMVEYIREMADTDNLVLTCFTPQIFKIAQFIRKKFNSKIRFLTHLHGQASVSCWPMRRWGGHNFFIKKDIFISSCRRDADCFLLSYPEAKVAIMPFSYTEFPPIISNVSKS